MLVLLSLALDPAEASPRSAPEPDRLATTQQVETLDGAVIALHHHPGRGAPVLLVHGISCNHRFFDLDPDHSLADWLADKGWDVWMLDLRGHGDALFDEEDRRQVTGWSVDDYGRYDILAAVDRIRRLTGYDTVAYVGHSMGGMVAAIYTQVVPEPHLAGMVILGSPAAFSKADPMFGLAQTGLGAGGAVTLYVDTPAFADMSASLGNWSPGRMVERLYNPQHIDKKTAQAMLRTVVAPMSRREMNHFARMIKAERFVSFDGKIDWQAGLAAVTVPTLVIAGTADQIAYPPRVRAYYDGLGGEKSWLEAADYGHLDLALGDAADVDIFPAINTWLRAHPPVRAGAPTPPAPPPP